MKLTYAKLVRDRIPEIIRADGCIPVTRVLDEPEYRTALLAKLVEEAREAQSAPEPDLAGELADVLEVLSALAAAADLPWGQLVDLTATKRDRRGGFDQRVYLEYVEQPD
jgi:predicted house-cleaning noncanonical NTP pyrophosphatase (MazG superfamily)